MYYLMVINLYPSVLIRKTRDTVDKNRGARAYLNHSSIAHLFVSS